MTYTSFKPNFNQIFEIITLKTNFIVIIMCYQNFSKYKNPIPYKYNICF